jgi:hypothetical protein
MELDFPVGFSMELFGAFISTHLISENCRRLFKSGFPMVLSASLDWQEPVRYRYAPPPPIWYWPKPVKPATGCRLSEAVA